MRDFYNIPGLLGHIRDTQVTETGIGPWPLKVYVLVNSLNQYFKNVDFFQYRKDYVHFRICAIDMIDTD